MHVGTLATRLPGPHRLDGPRPVPMTDASAAGPDAAARIASLFEETSGLVHRTAWRITRSSEDAEDVLQAVFLHMLKFPPEPWPDSPAAYVHRAAVNASVDVLRRRRRRPESPADETTEALGTRHDERDAVSRLEQQRLASRLGDALALLSPLEAEVFSLRFFEEKSNLEIAELLGKTPNHVGVTLHSARTKLKAALLDPNEAAPSAAEGDAQ